MKFNLDDSLTSSGSTSGNLLSSKMGQSLTNKVSGGNDSCCPTLTLKQRLIGYGVCTGLGNSILLETNQFYRHDYQFPQLWHFVFSHFRRDSQICYTIYFRYCTEFDRVSALLKLHICHFFNLNFRYTSVFIFYFYRSLFLSGPMKQLKSMFH